MLRFGSRRQLSVLSKAPVGSGRASPFGGSDGVSRGPFSIVAALLFRGYLLVSTPTPLPPAYRNHGVSGNFSIWSLKNKDLNQSIPE